jgi:hypothetical protein
LKLRERIAWILLGGALLANLELGLILWLRSSNTVALRQAVEERETLLTLVHEQWQKTTAEAGTLRERLRQCQIYVLTRAPVSSAKSSP